MENKKENKETKNKIRTEGVMGIKRKIAEYFQEYWRNRIFMKSVSVLVAAAFIVNIVNLPVYARDRAEDKRMRDQRNKQEYVLVSEDGGKISVNYSAAGIEVSSRVSEAVDTVVKEMDIKDAKTFANALRAVRDGKEEELLEGATEGKEELEKAINTLKIDMMLDQKRIRVNSYGNIEEEGRDGKPRIIGSWDKTNRTAHTTSMAMGGTVDEKAKAEKDKEYTARVNGSKVDEAVGQFSTTQYKYSDEMIEKLAGQSGLSKEEVLGKLEEARKASDEQDAKKGVEIGKTFDNAMALLGDFLTQGGEIINCATNSLAAVLKASGTDGKGVLAIQALCADLAAGIFVKNNEESIRGGATQLMTSMSAMQEVLKSYGKEAEGYGASLEDLMKGLGDGESGILWVNKDHYITVTKSGEDFKVSDSNV
ncbi:MAG: hypothetical protein FWC88_03045, partial [Endomicrobia bacterium]|nr:hypothetical protein [Endomicrobiia bacterium]